MFSCHLVLSLPGRGFRGVACSHPAPTPPSWRNNSLQEGITQAQPCFSQWKVHLFKNIQLRPPLHPVSSAQRHWLPTETPSSRLHQLAAGNLKGARLSPRSPTGSADPRTLSSDSSCARRPVNQATSPPLCTASKNHSLMKDVILHGWMERRQSKR